MQRASFLTGLKREGVVVVADGALRASGNSFLVRNEGEEGQEGELG